MDVLRFLWLSEWDSEEIPSFIIEHACCLLWGGYSLDMMWVTSPLSAHSQPCLASLVDVTVSPTGMRERGRKHKTSIHSYNGFHLEGPHLHTYTQYLLPNAYTHAQQVTTSSHRRQAKPKECNCYCIVNPLNSHSPGRSPSFSNSFYSLPPKILPQSLLAGPALFSWSSWTRLTKPSLLPISSETGAGTMIASLLAERGRGKRGPWELQADTLRVVQVSSSPGPVEKRRLICCRCFPREGGCRREEVVGVGAVRGGRARKTRRCRKREGGCEEGCPAVFKTDRLKSVWFLLSSANVWHRLSFSSYPSSPCFTSSPEKNI